MKGFCEAFSRSTAQSRRVHLGAVRDAECRPEQRTQLQRHADPATAGRPAGRGRAPLARSAALRADPLLGERSRDRYALHQRDGSNGRDQAGLS